MLEERLRVHPGVISDGDGPLVELTDAAGVLFFVDGGQLNHFLAVDVTLEDRFVVVLLAQVDWRSSLWTLSKIRHWVWSLSHG